MSQRDSGNPEEARPGGAGGSLRATLRIFLGLPIVHLSEAGLEGSGCRLDLLARSPRWP